jgi:hemoglobin-like flavoprotein
MTPQQIDLVQQTWRSVLLIQEQAATLFYNRLFELDPSLRVLFKGDMTEQGRKLIGMITAAVDGLSRLDALAPCQCCRQWPPVRRARVRTTWHGRPRPERLSSRA